MPAVARCGRSRKAGVELQPATAACPRCPLRHLRHPAAHRGLGEGGVNALDGPGLVRGIGLEGTRLRSAVTFASGLSPTVHAMPAATRDIGWVDELQLLPVQGRLPAHGLMPLRCPVAPGGIRAGSVPEGRSGWDAASVELRLAILDDAGARHEVAAQIEPEQPIDALVAALAKHLRAPEDAWLEGSRAGLQLAPGTAMRRTGLRQGDALRLRPPALLRRTRRPRSGLELVVVGGPAAGHTVELKPGDNVVGRAGSLLAAVADDYLSREHFRITVGEPVLVADLGSTNGTRVQGATVQDARSWGEDELVTAGRSLFRLRSVREDPLPLAAGPEGVVGFNRPPRLLPTPPPAAVTVPRPPETGGGAKLPLQAIIAPLLMGGLYLGVGGGAGGGAVVMGAMAALSAVMALSTYGSERIGGARSFRAGRSSFLAALSDADQQLSRAATETSARAHVVAPAPDEALRRARAIDASLWERRPADPDFLGLRVGFADTPSGLQLVLPEGGDPELRAQARDVQARHAVLPTQPVVLSLPTHGVLGLSGERADVTGLARWLVIQAATLQSPRDLLIAAAVDGDDWAWLPWLPHVQPEDSPLTQHWARTDKSARGLVQELLNVVEDRTASKQSQPAVLLVVEEDLAVPRAALSQLMASGAAAGVHVVWLGSQVRDLPGECGAYVDTTALQLVQPRHGGSTELLGVDAVRPTWPGDGQPP